MQQRIAFFVLLAALAWFGIRDAHAQYGACLTPDVKTALCQNSAYAQAGVNQAAQHFAQSNGTSYKNCGPYLVEAQPNSYWNVRKVAVATACSPNASYWDIYTRTFPSNATSECGPGTWDDPSNPGQCLTPEKCLEKNAGIGDADRVGGAQYTCAGGCDYGFKPGQSSAVCTAGDCMWSGKTAYTGYSCEYRAGQVGTQPPQQTPEQAAEVKQQECKPAGGGQTMCIKPNGDQCYTASTGRQICWTPGETGTKTDGPSVQTRKPGDQQGAPNMQLPNGDTATKTADTVKTTTTKPDGSTIVTSTTNYKSDSGADAGDKDQGEKDDGSEDADDGDGKHESSGGGNCDTPPTASGDPILGNILQQTWHTRCNTAGKLTDTGSCEAAVRYDCSGSAVLCRIANDEAKDRCEREKYAASLNADLQQLSAQPDGLENVDEHGLFDDGVGTGTSINEGLIGGGGGGQCAVTTRGIAGKSFALPEQFWTAAAFIKWLMIALAYIWVAYWMVK